MSSPLETDSAILTTWNVRKEAAKYRNRSHLPNIRIGMRVFYPFFFRLVFVQDTREMCTPERTHDIPSQSSFTVNVLQFQTNINVTSLQIFPLMRDLCFGNTRLLLKFYFSVTSMIIKQLLLYIFFYKYTSPWKNL